MKNRKFLFILIIPLIIAGVSAVVMLLWNAILPDLTGVGSLSFWQALGLLILCKILFGGFGKGCHGRKKHGPSRHFRNKWRNMNEEERQKLKEEWKKRCRWKS